MTSPIPTPDEREAHEDVRPGPGMRWKGDGGLARRRAPIWGGTPAPGAGGPPAAPDPARPVLPAPIAARRPSIDGMPLASVNRRLAAWIIDYFVKTAIFVVVLSVADVDLGTTPWADPNLVAASALLNAGYAFIFGIHGVTPAAYLLRIRIAALDGAEPGVRRSLVRAAAATVNEAFLFAGSLWVLFDQRRQTLYDKAAGTTVFERSERDRRA